MTETQNTSRRPGALIAMSGGVDSSVAAWLMQRDGFDCTGVTMRLTRNEAVNTEGLTFSKHIEGKYRGFRGVCVHPAFAAA